MRIYGPYQHRNSFIIKVVNGTRTDSFSFKSREEAEERKTQILASDLSQKDLTIEDHIKRYVSYLEVCKNKPNSLVTARQSLTCLFRGYEHLDAARLDTKTAREIYLALASRVAVDTQRISLTRARHMWRYLIDEGIATYNPWADVAGVGKRVKGKKKLTDDETRKLFNYCLAIAPGHTASLGIVVALLLGLRACEVRGIQARHFDKGCSVLRVYKSKSESGKRSILVPDALQKIIKPIIERIQPEELLFDRKLDWLNKAVQRTCAKLGLPMITGHSLRGIHASIATKAGATSELVAATLGHSHTDVTEEHYSGADAIAGRDVSNAEDLLLH